MVVLCLVFVLLVVVMVLDVLDVVVMVDVVGLLVLVLIFGVVVGCVMSFLMFSMFCLLCDRLIIGWLSWILLKCIVLCSGFSLVVVMCMLCVVNSGVDVWLVIFVLFRLMVFDMCSVGVLLFIMKLIVRLLLSRLFVMVIGSFVGMYEISFGMLRWLNFSVIFDLCDCVNGLVLLLIEIGLLLKCVCSFGLMKMLVFEVSVVMYGMLSV